MLYTAIYSKVPNKRAVPLIFFEKKVRPQMVLLGPPCLLIFGFSRLRCFLKILFER